MHGIETHLIGPDDRFPNNAQLVLIVYRNAFGVEGGGADGGAAGEALASRFERTFTANAWPAAWRNGVFAHHHYHSTAHEVLGVYRGSARLQLGGDGGLQAEVHAGDAIVIPAGVAHARVGSSEDFAVVGAYPVGQQPDACTGSPRHRAAEVARIRTVALPESDPLSGHDGPLAGLWNSSEDTGREK